jgi:heme oxygenase
MRNDLQCTPSQTFLSDIKNKTAASHKRLENLKISRSLLDPEMKLTEYILYLDLMYDVQKSVEETVFPLVAGKIPDIEKRIKSNLILEDITYLNFNKIVHTPLFKEVEMSEAFAMGILYVMEGSTLGGRFILKNVTKFPELQSGRGTSYFNGYGESTGSYWKAFLEKLSEYEENYNKSDSIMEGAVYAFDTIYNHFRRVE